MIIRLRLSLHNLKGMVAKSLEFNPKPPISRASDKDANRPRNISPQIVIGIALPIELLTKLHQRKELNKSTRIGSKETEKVKNHKSQL